MRSKYVLLLIVLVIQMVAAVGSAAGLSPMDAPLHGHEIEVTSGFTPRRVHPLSGEVRQHNGIDIGGDAHEAVYAVADGTVILARYESSFDGWVIMEHTASDGSK